VIRNINRIILVFFNGKVSVIDCRSVAVPVFPCEVYQALFFTQYLTCRYEPVWLLLKIFDVTIAGGELG